MTEFEREVLAIHSYRHPRIEDVRPQWKRAQRRLAKKGILRAVTEPLGARTETWYYKSTETYHEPTLEEFIAGSNGWWG